jgi:hypothetical protein
LLAAGVNVLVIARRLGHAKPDITLRTYAHLMPDDQGRASGTLGGILDRLATDSPRPAASR